MTPDAEEQIPRARRRRIVGAVVAFDVRERRLQKPLDGADAGGISPHVGLAHGRTRTALNSLKRAHATPEFSNSSPAAIL